LPVSAKGIVVQPENDWTRKLKWLIFYRILFSSLLLGSTILLQLGDDRYVLDPPMLILYALILFIFLISIIYGFLLNRVKKRILFAYVQITIDTLVVSIILFVTGNYASIFSFLYLVVIIYASMLLPFRGILIVASLCSIQFGIMVDLEYYGILVPFDQQDSLLAASYAWNEVIYKILITMMACFAVAFLSSFLSEQNRRTKKELRAMEHHVKRVEKMAAVGEMAAGLAHEIKNPLASLTGSIQLLREDSHPDPDQDRLMQIVLREADRLSSLANNFLLYARPPAGKVQAIQLDKALRETAELFQKDGSTDGRIETITRIDGEIWIAMDPAHLHQILWNLVLNAAEAIEGQGQVTIESVPSRNRMAAVKISDTGCGMNSETIQSIFDPFFTTKPVGTGLGLSIVHRILESYDAWMEVESEVGIGTNFTLRFRQIDPPTKA
jgi:two-component system sensor histidine kinase PilS (NtrC family)